MISFISRHCELSLGSITSNLIHFIQTPKLTDDVRNVLWLLNNKSPDFSQNKSGVIKMGMSSLLLEIAIMYISSNGFLSNIQSSWHSVVRNKDAELEIHYRIAGYFLTDLIFIKQPMLKIICLKT